MLVKQKGAIYLQRDRFQAYVSGIPSILEFRFVPQVVRDMDVVNQEMLANLIKVFVTNSKLPPTNFVIAIADNASFVKDFLQQPPTPPAQPGQPAKPQQDPIPMDELEKQMKDFFALVPFEEVASKSITMKGGIRAYATNKDLFETIKRSLEANGGEVSAVIPAIVFGAEVSGKPAMDAVVAGAILRKADSLVKEYNLLNQPLLNLDIEKDKESKEEADEVSEEGEQSEKPKNQLPLLLGLLGFLLIVLIGVAWWQFHPQSKQPAASTTQPPAAAVAAPTAISLSPSSAASSSAVSVSAENKLLSVQINNTSTNATQAFTLHDALEKFGFKSVNVSNQQGIGTSGTSITFSKNVSPAIRSAVISEVQKISPVTNILDKADASTDITIILSR